MMVYWLFIPMPSVCPDRWTCSPSVPYYVSSTLLAVPWFPSDSNLPCCCLICQTPCSSRSPVRLAFTWCFPTVLLFCLYHHFTCFNVWFLFFGAQLSLFIHWFQLGSSPVPISCWDTTPIISFEGQVVISVWQIVLVFSDQVNLSRMKW